jgi:ATP-dependent Zn protease
LKIKKRHPKVVERLAYHEAGHAIVAHHFDFEFALVTILPDEKEGSEGETLLIQKARSLHELLLTYLGLPNRTRLEQMLVVLMAGIEAVKLVRKQTTLSHYWEAGSDILRAHELAKQLGHTGDVDRNLEVAKASIEASSILKLERAALDAIARVLIAKTTLAAKEIVRLIESAKP